MADSTKKNDRSLTEEDANPNNEPDPQQGPKPDPTPEPEPKLKPEPKPSPKSQPEPTPEPKLKPKLKPEPESGLKQEPAQESAPGPAQEPELEPGRPRYLKTPFQWWRPSPDEAALIDRDEAWPVRCNAIIDYYAQVFGDGALSEAFLAFDEVTGYLDPESCVDAETDEYAHAAIEWVVFDWRPEGEPSEDQPEIIVDVYGERLGMLDGDRRPMTPLEYVVRYPPHVGESRDEAQTVRDATQGATRGASRDAAPQEEPHQGTPSWESDAVVFASDELNRYADFARTHVTSLFWVRGVAPAKDQVTVEDIQDGHLYVLHDRRLVTFLKPFGSNVGLLGMRIARAAGLGWVMVTQPVLSMPITVDDAWRGLSCAMRDLWAADSLRDSSEPFRLWDFGMLASEQFDDVTDQRTVKMYHRIPLIGDASADEPDDSASARERERYDDMMSELALLRWEYDAAALLADVAVTWEDMCVAVWRAPIRQSEDALFERLFNTPGSAHIVDVPEAFDLIGNLFMMAWHMLPHRAFGNLTPTEAGMA